VFLIEHAPFFQRDNKKAGRGLYTQKNADGSLSDYWDNGERFVFLCRAIMETAPHIGFTPDVIHANDWQTGLVPAYLSEVYRERGGFQQTRSILTIHNIAYQGNYPPDLMNFTGLPQRLYSNGQLEFYSQFSMMKGGIVFADAVNTVSPTYAREITTGEFGYGLDGLLSSVRHKLSGIVNGVDYDEWNPKTDKFIPKQYTPDDVAAGKAANKAKVLEQFKLPTIPDAPLLGVVARLDRQKGFDLIHDAAQGFIDLGCQMVLLGSGALELQQQLQALHDRYPDCVGIYIGYSNPLAHLIEAGSDLFLMPSRFEPCGLNQMYSLKYGTPPVVRSTGGLADTVVNSTEENLADGRATGFSFYDYTAHALYETVKWALRLMRDRPEDFAGIVQNAMAQNWSWDRSAEAYEALYRRVMVMPASH
jgi:starch synthase